MIDISVVIPSYNRKESLCQLVSVLIAQYNSDISTEIIVVLDGSTDGSAEALSKLTAPPEMPLRVYTQPNQGAAIARNTGLKQASGEIVLFLDDDVIPGERLIEAHLYAHRTTGAEATVGRIDTCTMDKVPRPVAEAVVAFHDQRRKRLSIVGATITATDVTTINLSVRRSRLLEVDGFDESFTGYASEDWDLGQRLLAIGTTFVYAPDAVVTQIYSLSFRQWQRRMWLQGESQIKLTRKHPELKPHVPIGKLHDPNWKRRLAAQFAIQLPRAALMVSEAVLWIAPFARWLGGPAMPRQLAGLSWRLAFWSGVRSALGSAQAVRTYCR